MIPSPPSISRFHREVVAFLVSILPLSVRVRVGVSVGVRVRVGVRIRVSKGKDC